MSVAGLVIEAAEGGVSFWVKVVPGSSRDEVVGVLGDALKVKVAAPAEAGKANRAVCALLARVLGVGKADVEVVSGMSKPRKRVVVKGVGVEAVRERLGRGVRG